MPKKVHSGNQWDHEPTVSLATRNRTAALTLRTSTIISLRYPWDRLLFGCPPFGILRDLRGRLTGRCRATAKPTSAAFGAPQWRFGHARAGRAACWRARTTAEG